MDPAPQPSSAEVNSALGQQGRRSKRSVPPGQQEPHKVNKRKTACGPGLSRFFCIGFLMHM